MRELLSDPDRAAEITLWPLRMFELDAAIIFSDILLVLDALDLGLDFVAGEGPRLQRPIRSVADLHALPKEPKGEVFAPTLDAIRRVKTALNGAVPIIGFVGAPFTLACYAIEGGSGYGGFPRALQWFRSEPLGAGHLLERLAEVAAEFLIQQIRAGADAVQVFDTWASLLEPDEYMRIVEYTRHIFRRVGETAPVPRIHFAGNSARLLEWVALPECEVVSVGADLPLDDAWRRIGLDKAIQGNLAPELLLRPSAEMEEAARDILRRAGGRPGHIFNLSRGILKETDPKQVRRLVELVHSDGWAP